MKLNFILILIFGGIFSTSAQTIWHVRAGASPTTADGASWATAIPDLRDALAAAQPGDQVWITRGVYKPTTINDRFATFTLPSGVALYGGFAGTETLLEQRNWALNPTILSGDIGVPGDSTDNSYGILQVAQASIDTRVDGLVFEWGRADNPDNVNVFSHERTHSGSAIYLNGQGSGRYAYLTIVNCSFRHNWSAYFGTVYANGRDNGKVSVRVENCRFERNYAYYQGGALAVENYAAQEQALLVFNTVFEQNAGRLGGGAVYAEHHQKLTFYECDFIKNTVYASGGGGVRLLVNNTPQAVQFIQCLFDRNLGGLGVEGGAVECQVLAGKAVLDFRDCRFDQLSAAEGGCIGILNLADCRLQFSQCLFTDNSADNGSVLNAQNVGGKMHAAFDHCLLAGNKHPEFTWSAGQVDSIRLTNCIWMKSNLSAGANGTTMLFDHCLSNAATCAQLSTNAVCGGGMLLGADPQFVDPAGGNFHLKPCSPAIDAGSNAAALQAGLTLDAAGGPRLSGSRVDIGPYESDLFFNAQTAVHPASCAGARDGAVNLDGAFCPPLQLSWQMGGESGTRIDSLAAGTYVFTCTDGAGHTDIDTVFIPEVPPLVVNPDPTPVRCFGEANGVAAVQVSGGTDPYLLTWANGVHTNSLFPVFAGAYPVTVTDANGCSAAITVAVNEPGLIEVYYTVSPASGPQAADGQVRMDSVIGCQGPFNWPGPALADLKPGTYTITITDPCGCLTVVPIQVGFATGIEESALPSGGMALSPNPTGPGRAGRLSWPGGRLESVAVLDAAGRLLRQLHPAGGATELELQAPLAAGTYWLQCRSGRRVSVLRWVVGP